MATLDEIGGYLTSLLEGQTVMAEQLSVQDKLKVTDMLMKVHQMEQDAINNPQTILTRDLNIDLSKLSTKTIKALIDNYKANDIDEIMNGNMSPEEIANLKTQSSELIELIKKLNRMEKNTLSMRLGENLGEILLDIAQEHIIKGEPEKAIETYTKSLHGFTEEYALMLLKNKAVLKTDPNGIDMDFKGDDLELLSENTKNIYKWQSIMNEKLDYIANMCKDTKKNNYSFFNIKAGLMCMISRIL